MSLVLHVPFLNNNARDTIQNSMQGNPSIGDASNYAFGVVSGGPFGRYFHIKNTRVQYAPKIKNNCQEITVSFWVQSSATNTQWQDIVGIPYYTQSGNVGHCRLEYLSGTRYNWYDNWVPGSGDGMFGGYVANVDTSSWAHVVLQLKIVGSVTYVTQYVNGVVNREGSSSNIASQTTAYFGGANFYVGTTSGMDFNIADLRVYDTIISHKEVLDLNKRPLLHYTFDNLVDIHSDDKQSIDGSFETYSEGSTVSFTNQANGGAVIATSEDCKNGSKCLKFTSAGASNRIYTTIAAQAGRTYLISCYMKSSSTDCYLHYEQGSDWAGEYVSYETPGEWQKRYTFYRCTAAQTLYVFFSVGNGKTLYVDDFKITDITDYVIKDNETMGMDSLYSNCLFNEVNSVIGSGCAEFDGTSYIRLPQEMKIPGPQTLMLWAFRSDWSTYVAENIISCTQGGGWGIGYAANASTGSYEAYLPELGTYFDIDLKLTSLSPGWHHIAITFDGRYFKAYINASLVGTYDAGTTTTISYNASNYAFIGAEASSSTTPDGYYWNGRIDDFRMYATALTASDIKDIFSRSASISNDYKLHCKYLSESNKTSVGRHGNVSAKNIIENQYITTKDGAKFLKIFSHDVSKSQIYFSDFMEAQSCLYTPYKFSRLKDMSLFKSISDSKYEFLLKYPGISDTLYNRWKQSADPLTTNANSTQTATTMGYEAVEIAWSTHWYYGMGLSTSNTALLDCEAGHGNWYGGLGLYSAYQSVGFPAPDGSNQQRVELYVRVDNTNFKGYAAINTARFVDSDDYQALEYIHSTGTQYINTGYYPNAKTKVECDFQLKAIPTANEYVFGACDPNGACFGLYRCSGGVWAYQYGNTSGSTPNIWTTINVDTLRHRVTLDGPNKILKLDDDVDSDVIISRTMSNTSNLPLYLFSRSYSSDGEYGNVMIYAFRIYENNTLIRDYIPCKRKSDNVGGMFENITKTFYPSATSTNVMNGYNALNAIFMDEFIEE